MCSEIWIQGCSCDRYDGTDVMLPHRLGKVNGCTSRTSVQYEALSYTHNNNSLHKNCTFTFNVITVGEERVRYINNP